MQLVCLFKGKLNSLASSRSFKPLFDNYIIELVSSHYFYISHEPQLLQYYIEKMIKTNRQDRFLYVWGKLIRIKRNSFLA